MNYLMLRLNREVSGKSSFYTFFHNNPLNSSIAEKPFSKGFSMRVYNIVSGGEYWIRTGDFYRVKVALSR